MTTRADPLAKKSEPPDRVHYATGVMLDAQDFDAEQLYHRGRLARALAYLHAGAPGSGSSGGTVAGLRVRWRPPTQGKQDDEIEVEPGMAIDRLGRIIEVPRVWCVRLQPWFEKHAKRDAQAPANAPTPELVDAYGAAVTLRADVVKVVNGKEVIERGTDAVPVEGALADVFIRFLPCDRGKTPAFATGPFDALDAVQPARMRDGFQLELVIRKEKPPGLPKTGWPDLAADVDPVSRRTKVQDAIFDAWREGEEWWSNQGPRPLSEHATGQDTTALFLARVALPMTKAADGSLDRAKNAGGLAPVRVDNYSRSFVYAGGALARLARA